MFPGDRNTPVPHSAQSSPNNNDNDNDNDNDNNNNNNNNNNNKSFGSITQQDSKSQCSYNDKTSIFKT